jgi:hypothetical protein
LICSAHQPNYLPYLGFFDKMAQCDVFVIQDEVQYERHDFQNRNKIKNANGATWLTVPVEHTGSTISIKEVRIATRFEATWGSQHWRILKENYQRAPFWKQYCDFFEEAYSRRWESLLDLNLHLIKGLLSFLKINTPLVMASSLNASGKATEMILAQCKSVGADIYLSGIGGRNYLDVSLLENAGIKVIFQNFRSPVYIQQFGEFIPDLSVVDYLFCNGADEWVPQSSVAST